MKIYTNTFDLRQPTEKKFWVAPHSDFKIGIKVIGNKPIQYIKSIWLFIGNTRIEKDSEDNDFIYFKIKSGDTGEVKYTIVVIDGNIKLGQFTLTQVVTDSTVYDQESGGEIPSNLEVDSINVDNVVDINGCGITVEGNDNICITLEKSGKITSPLITQKSSNGSDGITLENNSVVNNNSIPMIYMTGNYSGNQGCGALPYPNNFLYIENTYSQPVGFSIANIDIKAKEASGGCTGIGTKTFTFEPTVITDILGDKVIVLAARVY